MKKLILWGLVLFLSCKTSVTKIAIFEEEHKLEEFKDTELPFSHHVYDGIEGVILNANPPDACSPITGPPKLNISRNWFVLIAGNLCEYGIKVINAELAGYSAAIIYRRSGRHTESRKHPNDFYSNISAVLIRKSAGDILKENFLYTIDKRYRVIIYLNDTFDAISFLSLMVAALAGLIVLVMVSFMILKYVQQSNETQTSRLSSQLLERLPTSKFQTGDPYETCAICLEDFKNNDLLRLLPCCHGYHTSCIDQWLTENHRICPICKKKVKFNGEETNNSDLLETTPLLRQDNQRSLNSYRALSNNGDQDSLYFMPFNVRQTLCEDVRSVSGITNENETCNSLSIASNAPISVDLTSK